MDKDVIMETVTVLCNLTLDHLARPLRDSNGFFSKEIAILVNIV